MSSAPKSTQEPKDPRAVIAIGLGLLAVVIIVYLAYDALPGDVPEGQVNTKGENMVAITSAAFTAIAAVIAAYFGVKAANVAREDAEKHGERQAIRVAELAGAATPTDAMAAIDRAAKKIESLG